MSDKGSAYRRSIRSVTIIGLIGALLSVAIVMAVGIASFREFATGNHMREDLLYSTALRAQLQRIYEKLLTAEAGGLGYVVTGRDEFLAPLDQVRADIRKEIDALAQLSAERPQHAISLGELARYSDQEMRLLADMVETRNAAGALAASNVMETRRGKALMDRIRVVVEQVRNAEVEAIERKTYEVRIAGQRTKRTLLLLLAAAITVVGGSSLVMIAHLVGRRRAELALADTLARHRAILASAMDAIVVITSKGIIETANPVTIRMFGWSPEELTGRHLGLLFVLGEGRSEADLLHRLENFALEGGHAQELTGRRKNGTTFPIDVAVGQMRESDGNRLVAILHDVSERKRAEIMKNDFVSTVSHELRTPLTSIAGSLGLLDAGAAGPLPDAAKRLVGIAHQNSRRLVRLINDILDIEKMQSASVAFARAPVSVAQVAREAIEQNTAYADEHRVRLALDIEEGDSTVVGDHDRLIQVLTNLISNAVKFSPVDGVVRLTVERRGEIVRACVQDHGAGIPKAFRANMFTRFAQADNSDSRQRGGTGLGLAIVKDIVERHAGRVSFETHEGLGTTFMVDLPARLPVPPPEGGPSAAHVLLVSGDAEQTDAITAMLNGHGIVVECADTAAKAEGHAALQPYTVILLALRLRDSDGIALIRSLRRSERTRTTPLILLSRSGTGPVVEIADWFDIPPERDRLIALVSRSAVLARAGCVLHLSQGNESRRAVAHALRDLVEVIPAASLDDANAILAQRDCRLVIVDMWPFDLSLDHLSSLCRFCSENHLPLAMLSPRTHDPLMARRLDQMFQGETGALPAMFDVMIDHVSGTPAGKGGQSA
ncbi:MAG TPA: ATP-binding protein [Xanthobacteraceae bacterium]|nr:ATP-binding protein [Xanthobacteraceae bacterium]HQS47363.1 ATP-binding protein [Xanthobacteraceae bacterium]